MSVEIEAFECMRLFSATPVCRHAASLQKAMVVDT